MSDAFDLHDLVIAVAVIVVSLVIAAFFSGAEAALTAASRARMHALEEGGDARAGLVNRLLAARERFIGAMLLGKQVVTIGATAFLTSVMLAVTGEMGVVYATAVMTLLVLVIAEIAPKLIAINHADRVSLAAARLVAFFAELFGPLLGALETMVRGALRLFGINPGAASPLLPGHEELKGAVELLHREGGVERAERDMFGGVLVLKDLAVSDVMVHRTKMRSIDADLPAPEIVREVLAAPYTRLPLWRGEPDNIVGVVHAKDLLRALDAAGGDATKLDVGAIALTPWFVPDTTALEDQLQAFLRRKTHFALAVDEYGQLMGLVTLEDILEEIVGDIRDEHDIGVQGVRPQPDGAVNVEGSVPIRDLNRVMDWRLPDEEATTIAGLVIHEARAIPEPGQVFTFHGFRFEVMRKQRNRITLLKLKRMKPAP